MYCQAQNKIIMLSLFNHKKDKNNLQMLEQFAQEFGRKVLRNLKSRISGSSPARFDHINRNGHRREFQKIIEKQNYL